MIYCFGDSWGAGAGLNENENPFGYWLAKDLGTKFLNFSREGNSYPVIVTQIFDNIRFKYLNRSVIEEAQIKSGSFIQKNDIVLIVIPPDIRWMDEKDNALESWYYELDKERYMSWLGDKTEVWFKYHASLFTYTIQSALDSIGCKYLFMHNYGGEFIIDGGFKSLINTYNFLDIKKSLTTLLDGKDEYESWNLKSNAPRGQLRKGMYFGEDNVHPNELGHKRIAELIKERRSQVIIPEISLK